MSNYVGGRKIIFKLVTGSHLFGTSTPESDKDYMGIFLPSPDDFFGIDKAPDEWADNVIDRDEQGRNTDKAVDCKYYSLRKWASNAAKGQPWALEFLFAPQNKWIVSSPEWQSILTRKDYFLSKEGIGGFVGFAKSQVNKSVSKGANLRNIREIMALLEMVKTPNTVKFIDVCHSDSEGQGSYVMIPESLGIHNKRPQHGENTKWQPHEPVAFKTSLSDNGTPCAKIGGKLFNFGSTVKQIRIKLRNIERNYGTRSEDAAQNIYDWKSLYHAYRNLFEVREFLSECKITLPRPPEEIEFLMRVRNKDVSAIEGYEDHFAEGMDEINTVLKPLSPLPSRPAWDRINKLVRRIQHNHIKIISLIR